MNIKSNLQLISEAATYDLQINTEAAVELDSVKESYDCIPTAMGFCVTEAADVVVNNVNGEYFVEMVNLSPFMLDSGITSISKALNLVAEANGLPPRSVGLVIDSQESVNAMLASADARSKATGNYKIRENAIAKVQKNIAIANKLMAEGFNVAKKSKNKGVCPKCGKADCKCECGGSCGKGCNKECDASNVVGKAAISEKKECGANCKKESYSVIDSAYIFIENALDGRDFESLTEAEQIELIKEAAIKTKEDINEKLRVLDSKNASAEDYAYAFKKDAASQATILGTSAGAAVAASKAADVVGAVSGSFGLGLGTLYIGGLSLALLTTYALSTMTRIFNCPGSISDNIKYAKGVQKQFEKAIAKFEKKGDEKMATKCREAKEKVDARLEELMKKAEGKSISYQNTHNEKGERYNNQTNSYKKTGSSSSKK